MTAKTSFSFELYIDHPEVFPELAARAKDLTPVWDDIERKWARNNAEKFARSMGMEATGADVDPTVFWEGLAASTRRRKRKEGFRDQIMVETGALEESLEDTERFFHEETALMAAFGTPKAQDEEMKAVYNWRKRPTIFLGLADQKAIESDIANYLSFGADWKDVIFERGLANVRKSSEAATMDMEFADMMASGES